MTSLATALQRTAEAVQDHARRVAGDTGTRTLRALVRAVGPLQVELTNHAMVFDEDEMTLGSSVRRYDQQFGIAVGDTLVLVLHEDGEVIAVEVVGQSAMADDPEALGVNLGSARLAQRVAELSEQVAALQVQVAELASRMAGP